MTYTFGCRSPRVTSDPATPISHNVNFEPKFLEESRRYLFFLSLWCPHFSLHRNKHRVHISLKLFCRSLGGIFPLILMGTFLSLVLLLLQHMCSQRKCSLFKLFQPPYFSAFQPFQLFQIFIFLPFQLLHTFRYICLAGETVQVSNYLNHFKLFQPSYFLASLPEHA